jgi:2-polyprenyl-3-methyl-5-hydroxy-6-metoxy-1,4-benzoquinol methylase
MVKKSTIAHYSEKGYDPLIEVESKHFWFKGRNKIIEAILQKIYSRPKQIRFLEVGCGAGYVLQHLEKLGFQMTGLDMNQKGLTYARKRVKSPLLCCLMEEAIFKKKFDAVGAFDVLEHVDDENAFLKRCLLHLKPGGHVFITVPAFQFLWSQIDEIGGHRRRYSDKDLTKKLMNAGFNVKTISYFGMFILFPQFTIRKIFDWRRKLTNKKGNLDKIRKESITVPPAILNKLFLLTLIGESKMLGHISLPFGSSIIAVAQKK